MTLRIAMLGAARIGNMGLIKPAAELDNVEVVAIAAREPARAAVYARKHGITSVHDSYDDLLSDPTIDAIYNPLPNGLHCEWSIKALNAGKHVLCEKPLASNAMQVKAMAQAAEQNQRYLLEAFHYRFHPLTLRMQELMRELGEIEHIDVGMCFPLPMINDIRFNYALAGGATMDVGAYTTNILRRLARASGAPSLQQAPEVIAARPALLRDKVDRLMVVDLQWSNGCTGRLENSLLSRKLFRMSVKVRGSRGSMYVLNPIAPHFYNHISLNIDGKKWRERISGKASYTYQLAYFADQVARNAPCDLSDSVENMELIDRIYQRAGLPLRGIRD